MTPKTPPSAAPTAAELLNNPIVVQAMDEAWADSQPPDPLHRHEEGGWIYLQLATGQLTCRRAAAGEQDGLSLDAPPIVPGWVIVGTFHTHPNPTAEGWSPKPSPFDEYWANVSGVPWLIRADDGNHSAGPESRRGGLAGPPGYPM